MKDRLEQFLVAENITKAQFADSISVARAAVSHIFAGRNKPGYEFIVNTMKAYPSLNIEWLLTGNGDMFKNNQIEQNTSTNTLTNTSDNTSTKISGDTLLFPTVKETERCTSTRIKKVVVFYDDNTYEEIC